MDACAKSNKKNTKIHKKHKTKKNTKNKTNVQEKIKKYANGGICMLTQDASLWMYAYIPWE